MDSRKRLYLSGRSFGAVATVTLVVAMIANRTTTGCGRIREVASVAKTVSDMAKVGEEMSKNESESVDWENYELTEADVRTFYSGVQALQEEYPEIDFEIAMTATFETMSEGINIQKAVERETDMTYDQYSGLSTAIMVAQANAEGARFTTGFVDSMEQTMAEAEALDQETLSEEEKAAIEEQRAALTEAKAEVDSPEFKKLQEASEMISAVRAEMGFWASGRAVVALAFGCSSMFALTGCSTVGYSPEVHSILRAGPGYAFGDSVYIPATYRLYRVPQGLRRFPDGGQSLSVHEATYLLLSDDGGRGDPEVAYAFDRTVAESAVADAKGYRDEETLELRFTQPGSDQTTAVRIEAGSIREHQETAPSEGELEPALDINEASRLLRTLPPSRIGLPSPIDYVRRPARRRLRKDIVHLRGDFTYRREALLRLDPEPEEAKEILRRMDRYQESLHGYKRTEFRFLSQDTREEIQRIAEREDE